MYRRMMYVIVITLAAVFALPKICSAAVKPENNSVGQPAKYSTRLDTGHVLYQFTAPFNNVDGMAWDGRHLWLGCDGLDSIWKMDTLGNILATIPAPNITATGLCWDGQYLWCADGGTFRIYSSIQQPVTYSIRFQARVQPFRVRDWHG